MSEKKYKTPEAFRAAIEARAKKLRDESGGGLAMQRRKIAFDAAICEGQHFAEKLHALCRPRKRQNSRVKDLFDMVLFIPDFMMTFYPF